MAKPNKLAVQLANRRRFKEKVQNRTIQFYTDIVSIALYKLGFNHDDMRNFFEMYTKVAADFEDEIQTDYDDTGKELWVAEHHIDEALKEALPPEMFKPRKERYGIRD